MLKSRPVLFTVLILVCSLSLAVSASYACPPTDIEYIYYTDASKSVQCGWKYTTCYCSVTSNGCQTSFYDINYWDCFAAFQNDGPNATTTTEKRPLLSSSTADGCAQSSTPVPRFYPLADGTPPTLRTITALESVAKRL